MRQINRRYGMSWCRGINLTLSLSAAVTLVVGLILPWTVVVPMGEPPSTGSHYWQEHPVAAGTISAITLLSLILLATRRSWWVVTLLNGLAVALILYTLVLTRKDLNGLNAAFLPQMAALTGTSWMAMTAGAVLNVICSFVPLGWDE